MMLALSNGEIWGPVIAALLGGGFVQLISSLFGKKRNDAEASNLISEAADRIVGRLENEIRGLRDEIGKLNVQVDAQRKEIQLLQNEIGVLRKEIERLGGDPNKVSTLKGQL